MLHSEEESTLIFCWNCGAAQVMLSEELQELAETQRSEFAASSQGLQPAAGGGTLTQVPDLLVLWKSMIAIAAAVSAALSVVSVILPPLELLAWMAPALVLASYAARHRETILTAAVGARVGLVCGIFGAFGLALATAVQMLILRFGLHRGGDFDANMAAVLAQTKLRVAAQSGAEPAAFFNRFAVPEFRAGFFLASLGLVTAILLALSTAGGAFAGFIRSRTPRR